MTQIANLSRSTVVLRDKAGKPFSIEANGTANHDVDKDHPLVASQVAAGNIVLGGTEKQAQAAARAGIAPGAIAASQPAA